MKLWWLEITIKIQQANKTLKTQNVAQSKRSSIIKLKLIHKFSFEKEEWKSKGFEIFFLMAVFALALLDLVALYINVVVFVTYKLGIRLY